MKVRVFAACESASAISHPIDGRLKDGSGEWEMDGFTARMIVDGAVSLSPRVGKSAADVQTAQPAMQTRKR